MKNDRKNVSNMVIAIVCVVLFAATAIYCVPRFALLSSNALPATLVMTLISGAFLLFHAVSARLLSKKNPYGGKLFWFFKF
ncbi:MAG: hypothetical protein EGR78_00935 [Erysipelotrichaceae bacterium]|nr:hypothetical protein [Erysipelotrichaceae bacterium]